MRRPKKGKDGLYHIQKYIGKFPDGSNYYERFKGEIWVDVLAEAEAFKRAWRAGLAPQPPQKQRNRQRTKHILETPPVVEAPRVPLLGDAIDRYIETCELTGASPATIAGYASIRKRALPALMSQQIDAISLDDIQAALNDRARTHSPKTVRNELGLLRPVLGIHRPDLDLRRLKIAKNARRKKLIMSNAGAQEILLAAQQHRADFYIYVLFGLFAGLRPSESYALLWRDISAAPLTSITRGQRVSFGEINVYKARVKDRDGVYRLKGTKTDAGDRTITVDWSFFETLYDAKPRGKDDERILTITPEQCTHEWGRLRRDLGLPKGLRYYDLRHYYASAMIAAGAPEDYVAASMGHSTVDFTHQIYVELIAEKQSQINADMATHTARLLNGDTVDYTRNTTQLQHNALPAPETASNT